MKRLFGVLLTAFVLAAACKSSDDTTAPGETAPDGGSSGDDDDTAAPTEPAVAYVGRFLVEGDSRTVSWPGSRIIARFDGTSVSAKIEAQTLDPEGPSVFNVILDGKTTKLTMQDGEQTYELGKDLAAGTHQVELYLRTEGQYGKAVFKGFDFGGGKLLPPPKPRGRRVEILGDSSASGYGVECTDPNTHSSTDTENFAKAWGAKIGEMVNADVIGTIYSGKGVVQNNDRTDTTLYPEIYLRTAALASDPAWDFSKLSMDAVVVMLGGNDYDEPTAGTNDAPDFDTFEKGYAQLLATVRQKYPKAFIVSVLSPTQNDDYPPGYQARTNEKNAFTQAVDAMKKAGDNNVAFVEVSRADDSELTACEFHPNEALHTRIATAVSAEIKRAKNW